MISNSVCALSSGGWRRMAPLAIRLPSPAAFVLTAVLTLAALAPARPVAANVYAYAETAADQDCDGYLSFNGDLYSLGFGSYGGHSGSSANEWFYSTNSGATTTSAAYDSGDHSCGGASNHGSAAASVDASTTTTGAFSLSASASGLSMSFAQGTIADVLQLSGGGTSGYITVGVGINSSSNWSSGSASTGGGAEGYLYLSNTGLYSVSFDPLDPGQTTANPYAEIQVPASNPTVSLEGFLWTGWVYNGSASATGSLYLKLPAGVTYRSQSGIVYAGAEATPVDTSAPISTASANGGSYASGSWTNGDVNIALSAMDPDGTSDVAKITYSASGAQVIASTDVPGASATLPAITAEGITTITFHATDVAGNAEAAQTFTIRIDKTAPRTTAMPGGPTGANGWYTGPVTVGFTFSDANGALPVSGLKQTLYNLDGAGFKSFSLTSPGISVTGDGIHTVTFYSIDGAGNIEDQTNPSNTLTIKIDATPPSTTATPSGPAGSNGWYRGSVTVTLAADDGTSGQAETIYSIDGGTAQGYSAPFSVSGAGAHTVQFHSVDAAGNVEATQMLSIKIDTVPPATSASLSGTAGHNGWYRSPAQVTLSASDDASGVQVTSYSVDGGSSLPYTGAFTVSGDGSHTVSFSSTDLAGNGEEPGSVSFKIDSTPPALTVSDVAAAATSASGAVVTFSPGASDSGSGLAGVVSSPASGTLFPLGRSPVTTTATDNAGNATTKTFTVNVTYACSGFLQPINADGSSIFKLGSTVPVKFQLLGASAGITNAVARLSIGKVTDNVVGSVNEATSTSAADTGNLFRYDPTSGQYIFNLNTKTLAAGTYQLQIDLGDGVTKTVNIGLR